MNNVLKIDIDVLRSSPESYSDSIEHIIINNNQINVIFADKIASISFVRKINQGTYFFPNKDFFVSNEMGSMRLPYSANMPFPIGTIYGDDYGVTIISENGLNKDIEISRCDSEIRLSFYFKEGDDFNPDFKIFFHKSNWRCSFDIYRSHYLNKYPLDHSNYFESCFHFKRYAFHNAHLENNIYIDEHYYLFHEFTKDVENFGGIDVVQLFDWAYDEENGRVGAYSPWEYLKNIDELNNQINYIRCSGAHVLAYLDGYFVKKDSSLSNIFGLYNTIKDPLDKPYYQLGEDHWVICSFDTDWRLFLTEKALEVSSKLDVDCIYLDQLGYGYQYTCYDAYHHHHIPSSQNQGEKELIEIIKSRCDKEVVLEYFPIEELTPLCDAYLTDNDALITFSRFMNPYKKLFKVITCDEPIGENVLPIKKALFNGLGLWLDGDSANEKWYANTTRELIRKHYYILKKYKDYFESADVIPLIDVNDGFVLANRFNYEDSSIITLFNNSDEKVAKPLVPVKEMMIGGHRSYSYIDVYHKEKDIEPVFVNGIYMLEYEIEPHDVGVILIKRNNHI